MLPGTISTGGTNVKFTIPMFKFLNLINTITIKELKINIRTNKGLYLESNTNLTGGYDFLTEDYTWAAVKISRTSTIGISITKNSGAFQYADNNTPLVVQGDRIVLEFS